MSLIELRQLHNSFIRLYDPPVDGQTPLDGAGDPRTSQVRASDVDAKIALGCTREPVGPQPPVPSDMNSRGKPSEMEKASAKK